MVASLACFSWWIAQTIKSDVRLVVLPVTVADRSGHPAATDLRQSAFSVFENGAPQTIRTFRHEDVPVAFGLVLDHSRSMSLHAEKVEAAALDFVKESNPEDQTFVVNFGGKPYLDADFTHDAQVLKQALRKSTISGNTTLRDALSFSIHHMVAAARKEKRVLFVITDGDDIQSSITLEALIVEAQRADVSIYAVGLGTDSRSARRDLTKLAQATGGDSFFPKDASEIDRIARDLARSIRGQYTIGYTPPENVPVGSYRPIRVQLKGKGKLVVRTRAGYYRPA